MDEHELADLTAFIRGQLDELGLVDLRNETDVILAQRPSLENSRQVSRGQGPGEVALRYLRAIQTLIVLDLGRERILGSATERINSHLARWSEHQLEAFTLVPPSLTQAPDTPETDIALSRAPPARETSALDDILELLDEAIEVLESEVGH